MLPFVVWSSWSATQVSCPVDWVLACATLDPWPWNQTKKSPSSSTSKTIIDPACLADCWYLWTLRESIVLGYLNVPTNSHVWYTIILYTAHIVSIKTMFNMICMVPIGKVHYGTYALLIWREQEGLAVATCSVFYPCSPRCGFCDCIFKKLDTHLHIATAKLHYWFLCSLRNWSHNLPGFWKWWLQSTE